MTAVKPLAVNKLTVKDEEHPEKEIEEYLELPEKDEPEIEDGDEELEEDEAEVQGELYQEALKIVSDDDRDDGRFGLNTDAQKIGDYTFTIEGDTLKVVDGDDEHEFTIDDIDVWIILLAKTPGNYIALTRPSNTPSKRKKSSYAPAVKTYVKIANELNLLETAEEYGRGYKTLSKYKILKKVRTGKGFLFSTKPPPFLNSSNFLLLSFHQITKD